MLGKVFKIKMMALGVLAGGLLASCSMDNEPSIGKSGMLAKAPKMSAYSGNHYWGTTSATRGSNMNANMWGETYDCPVREANDLTADELAELKELLSPGHAVENKIVINFEEYWVQQIFKGDATYIPDDVFGDPCNGQSILGSSQMDHFEVMGKYGYEHVENFNRGDNTNYPGNCSVCGKSHFGTTLKVDMPTSNTDPTNQFRYWESFGSDNYCNYIIVEYKGYYYLGFDYQMEKEANNHNEADHVDRDWNFTDWIVRIIPAYHTGTTPSENPGQVTDPTDPETPEIPEVIVPDYPIVPFPGYFGTCIVCGHDHELGTPCEQCDEEGEHCTGPDNTTDSPFVKGEDEVEINLAVDKKNHDLLESHLSIHVRSVTNVEVFIPVPAQYYCDVDDMDIVLNHGNFVHGGPIRTEFDINGNTVGLNVEFVEGGIRIWTDGINEAVIEYCRENYQDGITFEVWNYFNNPETGLPYLSMEDLKEYLDQATVKFLDKEPGAYINAFGKDNGKYGTDNPDGKDFHVTPETHLDDYDEPYDGPHFNGSDNNEIYKKK